MPNGRASAKKASLESLIAGCGRSGTNYVAQVARAAGVPCGHEDVFDVRGWTGSDLITESSWYAVPFMADMPKLDRILHVVRSPEAVMRSFYRIGMVSDGYLHHASRGRPVRFAIRALSSPRAALARLEYVKAHRHFLHAHSDVMNARDEMARLEHYWFEWNSRIEAFGRDRSYLRVRLEDVGDRLEDIAEFMGWPALPNGIPPSNTKTGYLRTAPPAIVLGTATRELALKYGYA